MGHLLPSGKEYFETVQGVPEKYNMKGREDGPRGVCEGARLDRPDRVKDPEPAEAAKANLCILPVSK
jgi:hypothetical protein